MDAKAEAGGIVVGDWIGALLRHDPRQLDKRSKRARFVGPPKPFYFEMVANTKSEAFRLRAAERMAKNWADPLWRKEMAEKCRLASLTRYALETPEQRERRRAKQSEVARRNFDERWNRVGFREATAKRALDTIEKG